MKFVGSKARLSKDLAPIINRLIKENNIKTYIEPFVGGANMIQHIDAPKKVGMDINEYLIAMWNKLKNGYKPPAEVTKEEYLRVKNNMDKYPKEYVAIVGFCATYNAGWFRRYGGQAVTKEGKVRNYYAEAIRNLEKQVPEILDVEFIHGDYKELKCSNCLIYCDPPYEKSSYEMFKDSINHKEFWDWVRTMSKNNIVLVSEYTAPEDFECIYKKELTTSFDNKQRKQDVEKLFRLKQTKKKLPPKRRNKNG